MLGKTVSYSLQKMLSKRSFCLLLFVIPAAHLQLSPEKNLIWTVQNVSTKVLKYVTGEPPSQHRGNIAVQTLRTTLGYPGSLTFDFQNSSLYYANLADASLYKIDVSSPAHPNITVVHRGFSSAPQIAMDWSTGNLYWVDYFFFWIAMKSLKKGDITDFKIVVESDVEKPTGLALDPTRGYMFWPEKRKTPVIRRAGLDGTERRVLSVGGMITPGDMTIDIGTGKIYWVDHTKDTLESCMSDGTGRRIVKKKNGLNFVGVAYYKNTLFVTDDETKQVLVIRDETGIEQAPFPDEPKGEPGSIIVYAEEQQPSISDPCLSLTCEHFCVRTVSSARCLCQDGYKLSKDGYSCTAFFHAASPSCPVRNGTNITAIASHTHQRVVYYADKGRSEICSVSLRTKGVSTIVSNAGQVEGLTVDWLTNTIYWTDSSSSSINSMGIASNIRTSESVAVTGKLGRVTVDPFSRQIFWVTTNPASIVVKGYDSRDTLKTLVKNDINKPADIHCDPAKERVLWADSGSIKAVNMDGSGQTKLMSTFDSNNQGLVSSKAFVIWTSQSSEATINARTIGSEHPFRVNVPDSSELVDVDVLDASAQQPTRGVCFDNGGCDHFCVPIAGGRECRCELGYELDTDGRTCSTEYLQEEHIVVADLEAKRLYQVDTTSGKLFGSFLVDDYTPAVATDPSSMVLYWSDVYQKTVKSSYLNGSSIKTLFYTGLEYADRLAVDPATGNIFYSANAAEIVGQSYIAVASPGGKYKRKLVTGLNRPRALELHSSQGIMFWSDYGNDPHIGRANMDGSQREIIISTKIKFPDGIAIDFEANLLYWADGFHDAIERCSFYGANRQIILEDKGAYLMALAINKNNLYYTAWNIPGITVVNKVDGSNRRLLAESPLYGELSDLIIIQPNSQRTVKNACLNQNGGCSSLCLPTEAGKTCACSDGIDLQLDGLTCVGDVGLTTTGTEIETTLATDSSMETQTGSEVIIYVSAGTVVVIVVSVVVTAMLLFRRRRSNRLPETVVYSVAQGQGPFVPADHGNEYCSIRDLIPPPVPSDDPPAYIDLVDGGIPAETYLSPRPESGYSEPKK